MFIVYIWC